MGKSKNGVPDRWTQYKSLGKRIPGTRFIAFKVPLKKTFDWKLAPNERFSPLDLINQVAEQEEELGLVIDLTYTTRYYEPEELLGTVQYRKIVTVGHEVPNKKTVFKFKSAVKKFLMANQHNDKLIGVHCTHGVNRTGYLICRYLIDIEGMNPNMAIELFNRCRGHAIERKNYIEALQGGSRRRHFQPRRGRGRQNPQGQRHHPTAVSECDWMEGHYGITETPGFRSTTYSPRFEASTFSQQQLQSTTYSPRFEASTFSQQQLQQLPPRQFPSRRGRGGQNPQGKPDRTNRRNLISCYDNDQSVYHPQYFPSADIAQQGLDYPVRSSQRLHYSPYQQQLQGHTGPYFPGQSPCYPQQQGRYTVDRRHR